MTTTTWTAQTAAPGISDVTTDPPDISLAVGASYVVSAAGSQIEWTNISTNVTTTESLATLFATAPDDVTTNEPQVISARLTYDAAAGLYVLVDPIYLSNGETDYDIATSADPSKSWTVSSLQTGSSFVAYDAPSVSADGSNVYLSVLNSAGTSTFIVPLADVTTNATITTTSTGVTSTTNTTGGQFANVSGGGMTYLVAAGEDTATNETIILFQSYNPTTGTYSSTDAFDLGNADFGPPTYSTGTTPSAGYFPGGQAGSSFVISDGDSKLQSLAYANIGGTNYVYGVSEVTPAAGAQPEFEWFQIDADTATATTAPTIIRGGDISPASLGFAADVSISNASIAVDSQGDVIINFVASGATSMDPSDFYIVAGPTGNFGAATLYQAGNAPLTDPIDPNGFEVFGSYSTAVADPNNPTGFYITNEYATNTVTAPSGESGWWATATDHVSAVTVQGTPPTIDIVTPDTATTVAALTINGQVTSNDAATVAGETVTLTDNGVFLGSATVGANGAFTANVTLPDVGANSIIATVTDSSGTVGTSSASTDWLATSGVQTTIAASDTNIVIDDGVDAVINGTGDTLSAGSNDVLTDVGGNDVFNVTGSNTTVTGQTGDKISLISGTGDTVSGSGGFEVDVASGVGVTLGGNTLSGPTISVVGSGAALTLQSNSRMDLSGSNDSVTSDGGALYGVAGSDNTIAAGAGDQVWLLGTGDTVTGPGGFSVVAATSGVSATLGGNTFSSPTIDFLGSGATLTLQSNSRVDLTGSNDSVTSDGGALYGVAGSTDTIAAGAGDQIWLNSGSGETVTGPGGFVLVVASGVSATLGGNTLSGPTIGVLASGAELTLQSNSRMDLSGSNDSVTSDGGALYGVSGSTDTIAAGAGDQVWLLGTAETVTGAGGFAVVAAASGVSATLGGNGLSGPTIDFMGSGATLTLQSNSRMDLSGSNDSVTSDGGALYGVAGSNNTIAAGASDQIWLNSGTGNVVDAGLNDAIIASASSSLFSIAGNVGTLTIDNFNPATSGVIDLLNGVGGYGSSSAASLALTSDDHGGSLLSLGANGSVDFAGVAPGALSAANFKIG